jgi:hypothetical protein
MIRRSASSSLASLKAVTTTSPRTKFPRVSASLPCSGVKVSEVTHTTSLMSLDIMLEHLESYRHKLGYKKRICFSRKEYCSILESSFLCTFIYHCKTMFSILSVPRCLYTVVQTIPCVISICT